ncbi:MAG: hypothetical protein EOO86_08620 [Pedobacter sp.]|nr:MAG: hypothetical protein EOO86_08620 [Pedobacter sp.]
MKRILLLLIINLCSCAVKSQEKLGFEIKSNLLNLVAKKPSFSIEKTFKNRYGLELSYTMGELNLGRDYKYDGFLLRAKWYARKIDVDEITPFLGIYAGNLNKTIVSNNAYIHPTGFLSFGNNRNFKANSIRSGINLGLLYLPTERLKKKMIPLNSKM